MIVRYPGESRTHRRTRELVGARLPRERSHGRYGGPSDRRDRR